MTDQFRNLSPMTYEDTTESISSQESQDGTLPCDSQDGQQPDLFGLEAAPASLGVPPDKARRPMTNGISGLTGTSLSVLYDQQQSLANRLSLQLDGAGSTLFTLTWQRKATPLGLPYFQLVASGLPISETDCGSWPTTTKMDGHSSARHGYMLTGNQGTTLLDAARLTSWPTPTQHDAERGGQEKRATTERHGSNLQDFAMTSWATPTNRDYRFANATSFQDRSDSKKGEQLNNQVVHHGPMSNGSPAATARRGQLNPAFSLWLMGYPEGWANFAPRGIQWSRKSQRSS